MYTRSHTGHLCRMTSPNSNISIAPFHLSYECKNTHFPFRYSVFFYLRLPFKMTWTLLAGSRFAGLESIGPAR